MSVSECVCVCVCVCVRERESKLLPLTSLADICSCFELKIA